MLISAMNAEIVYEERKTGSIYAVYNKVSYGVARVLTIGAMEQDFYLWLIIRG